MSHSFQSDFQFGNVGSARRLDPQDPFRILVLGDFSGQSDRAPLSERKLLRIDVDNFEQIFAKLHPTAKIEIATDGAPHELTISFDEIDDFHPDSLVRKVGLFSDLRDLRRRLGNPATFNEALSELGPLGGSPAEGVERSDEGTPSESTNETDSDLFERVLGKSAQNLDPSTKHSAQPDIQNLIAQIVAPHIVPGPDPRQDEYVAKVDVAVAAQMKSILHHPGFQALEANWLSLQRLVNEVTHVEEVQVFLLDVTRAELAEQTVVEGQGIEASTLYRRVVEERDQTPFSLLAIAESFSDDVQDLMLLSRLGAIGAYCGGPILAGASAGLFGINSWTQFDDEAIRRSETSQENWNSLRSSPVASWIGISGPGVLARLPYGAKTGEVDAFAFEEIDDPIGQHDSLLWGVSSIYLALLLAKSFQSSGWSMRPGEDLDLDDLPALVYQDDGESQLKACAEVYVSERQGESILQTGMMPLLSYNNRNAFRVLRFQSIADPPTALSGRWS